MNWTNCCGFDVSFGYCLSYFYRPYRSIPKESWIFVFDNYSKYSKYIIISLESNLIEMQNMTNALLSLTTIFHVSRQLALGTWVNYVIVYAPAHLKCQPINLWNFFPCYSHLQWPLFFDIKNNIVMIFCENK